MLSKYGPPPFYEATAPPVLRRNVDSVGVRIVAYSLGLVWCWQ